jgi:DNA-binding response OmpR family regulator
VKTLLLLEDEPDLLVLLRHLLKPYSLIEAATAEQALRLFNENGRRIDLLLADVTLPTGSGIQVALLLRSEIPSLPVILTSGYPVSVWDDRDAADLERLGASSVAIIQKPFKGQVLPNTVREMIGIVPFERVRTA